MKNKLQPLAIWCGMGVAFASAQPPALLNEPISGNEVSNPEARAAFRPAVVEETTVLREGERMVTAQRLAPDPEDPVRPVVKPEQTPAQTSGTPVSAGPSTPGAHLPLISATVHPGPATFLSWTHNFPDGTAREFSGWSNIDWNHLAGVSTFPATDGERHPFLLAVGNAGSGGEFRPPLFPSKAPTFLPDQKDIPAEALVAVGSLHKLYSIDHENLAAAHVVRERLRNAKEAEILANPPQPKDLIIRYRVAETPLPSESRGRNPETR